MKLIPQIPAEGIMKTGDFGDSKFYSIQCNCGNPDDTIVMEVEADDYVISVNLYFTPKTDWWTKLVDEHHKPYYSNSFIFSIDESIRSLINSFYTRIKHTYTIWTEGYLKYQQTTLLTQQQALNFADTLVKAIDDVGQFKKEST
jgi:hypothetical protein